jgi:hypothetical protein
MTPGELETIAILTAFFGTGTFLLIGLKMFLTYRSRRLPGSGGEDVRQLSETVDDLRRDLADTRAELADVHERMDFAERLLTKARDAGRLEGGP